MSQLTYMTYLSVLEDADHLKMEFGVILINNTQRLS